MQKSGLITLSLDGSNLGELRKAVEALAEMPDETFVTFTAAIEIRFGQIGSRATALNAHPGKTDEDPAAEVKPNRAQRRAWGAR